MNTLISLVLASSLLNPEYVTCNIWKYTKAEPDGMVCIYLGKNGTIAYHYPLLSYRECPKQWQCPYMPQSKGRVTIKDIMKGLSDGF